jgi:hypothetical protein
MDWEQWAVDHFGPIAGVPTSTGHGATAPYLRIRRVGGAARNRLQEDVVLAFEWYAGTETAALAGLLKLQGYLLQEVASVQLTRWIRSVSEVSGPVRLPDPQTPNVERYSMTVSLGVRRRQTPKED